MKPAVAALAVLLACSGTTDPPGPTATPRPAVKPSPAPTDHGRQFAGAWVQVFEQSAHQVCGCADDSCRANTWMLAMVWLRDAFDSDEGFAFAGELDDCFEKRLRQARAAIESCASHDEAERAKVKLEVAECPAAPPADEIEIDPWWEQSNPCPDGTELELKRLPPPYPPRVFRAGCANDGVEQGRYTSFHLNGSVFLDGSYRDGKRHGSWKHHYLHGLLASEETWVDGSRHGPVDRVYRDGSSKVQGTYHLGARYGAWTEWPASGGAPKVSYYDNEEPTTKAQWEADGPERLCMLGCGDVPTKVNFHVTARRNLESARARVKAGDWPAALRYYNFLIARFPYSSMRKDAEAELRTGAVEINKLKARCVAACDRCSKSCRAPQAPCLAVCDKTYAIP